MCKLQKRRRSNQPTLSDRIDGAAETSFLAGPVKACRSTGATIIPVLHHVCCIVVVTCIHVMLPFVAMCRDMRLSSVATNRRKGHLIITDSRPVNFTELFDYAHVHLRAEPDSPDSPRRPVSLKSRTQQDRNVEASWDDDAYADSAEISLSVGSNYDSDTGRAADMRIPIESAVGEVYCENCYARANFGVEYALVRITCCSLLHNHLRFGVIAICYHRTLVLSGSGGQFWRIST